MKNAFNLFTALLHLLMNCNLLLFQMSNVNKAILCSCGSVALSCLTLCDPMNCSMSGLPVHHQLPQSTLGVLEKMSGCLEKHKISERLLLSYERPRSSWLPEKNSIQGQRRGFITQSFCVIEFY